jgi:RNA polymerase sigma-70 factor, ECF subfamily
MMDGDAELVERIRHGAIDDFSEIVSRHKSHVFAILYRYEHDPHRLEDLAQQAFIKAWQSLGQFDGRSPFQHWLSRIAINVALDHLRKMKRSRNEIGFPDLGEDALETLRNPDEKSDWEPRQAQEILAMAMRTLSPAEQLVITLQEMEGRSIKEISALTGSSGIAVRVRAMRARNKLRKTLNEMEKESNERTKTP